MIPAEAFHGIFVASQFFHLFIILAATLVNKFKLMTYKKKISLENLVFALITISVLLTVYGCNAQSAKNKQTRKNNIPDTAAKNFTFTPHIIEYHSNGKKESEIDTITGYHKFWFDNGHLEMEGKVSKSINGDYRDSVWKYYSDSGQLMRQETYNLEGKINARTFMYFANQKKMSEKYEYFEGDYNDKSNFKFHTIEILYYTNGQAFSERHSINAEVIEEKCWDSKGNSKPIEYLKTVKSVYVEE